VTRWLLVLVALAVAAGAWHWWTQPQTDIGGVLIAGGDGGGLPRAEPAQEGFDAAALQEAAAAAFRQDTSALLVTRHGHLIYVHYARGAEVGTLVEGAELAQALLMIAAGIAVSQNGMVLPAPPFDAARVAAAIATASGRPYPLFLSRHVWQPIHAATARWIAPDVRARAVDWLRVAELLLHDGRFEGSQVVQAGWISTHLNLVTGAEGPVADELSLRGTGSTRLWLVPRLDLAILRVAPAPPTGTAVDEALARTLANTLRDRPHTGGNTLNDIVPGH
jgi:CubicO group peptidase (beta-lactamase class C family)